ncbi:GBF-interacting protein 1-like isoform X2 [Lotus japonicus]|uniref:GBF-interacting protein 1-like isoform X2 n=1 Tax=Lotus japonicus TaxID=34305 RepID=UPI00258B0C2D|nr:GBF-interacting protein 1-like isoform X2 [Lotus japonicus]
MNGGVGSGSRVPMIPNNARKTIQDIREITGKLHSDDEIYSVLKECSMDPNETAQKLLYLDTFHEVKRRRDRKKDGLSSRASEESRLKPGGQGRGGRGASGGYSSNLPDGGGGRSLAIRRENGVNHTVERIRAPSTHQDLLKKNNTASQGRRGPSVVSRGAVNQSNAKSGHGSASQSLVGSVVTVPKSSSAANGTVNQENLRPQAAAVAASPDQTFVSVSSIDQEKSLSSTDQSQTSVSGVYSPSSDPVLEPSISRNHGVNGAISREVGSNRISAGPNHVMGNKLQEDGDLSASNNENSGSMNSTSNLNATQKSNEVINNQLPEPSQLSSPPSLNGSLRSSSSCSTELPPAADVTEVSTLEACVQSSAELRHVTFPNHFQVPKALKSGLTFGSFNNTFGQSERSSRGTGCENNASPVLESSLGNDEAATSCNQSVSLTAEGDHLDYSHPPTYLIKNTPASEGTSITVTDPKIDQPKQEVLLAPEGHPNLTVQSAQNYGLNFMSTMLGTQQVQFEGSESQAQETSRFPNFVSSSSQAVSPSSTPPLQNSIPVSPHPASIFRPPYPANFFPYGPYYPPFYLSPVHQFLTHNGFPQQPSAGNMYLPAAAAAAAAAGIQFPLHPQYKTGANTGNAAHIGIPSGSFITPSVGYAPSPAVNTGTSAGNEDLSVSQLKENQIYSTGQLSEGSPMWMHAPPGQDMSSLQVSSLYNLTPQGQHLTYPPTQGFAGLYQPGQTVAPPSNLLQQSQAAAAGPVETSRPPSATYQQQQQPQPSQINWNSNF